MYVGHGNIMNMFLMSIQLIMYSVYTHVHAFELARAVKVIIAFLNPVLSTESLLSFMSVCQYSGIFAFLSSDVYLL